MCVLYKKLTVIPGMKGTGRKSGLVILNPKLSNSGGVGVLFSKGFNPSSVEVDEIMCGHILKVKVHYENMK